MVLNDVSHIVQYVNALFHLFAYVYLLSLKHFCWNDVWIWVFWLSVYLQCIWLISRDVSSLFVVCCWLYCNHLLCYCTI